MAENKKAKQEEVNEQQVAVVEEAQAQEEANEQALSSLELLWKNAYVELDNWAERGNYRDEIFLKAVKDYSESVKRNRDNIKEVTEQFNKELVEWQRTAREEFLMSTTAIQHFFPIRSYEEINQLFDRIQKSTVGILSAPYRAVNPDQALDKYIATVEKYIELRKKGRNEYVATVKKTSNIVQQNQKVFVNLFSKQVKALFPLNKHMEKTEEVTKS
ncbi:hypothetical protein M3182_07540 [Mesobacillus maritimus]|uniref:hypothetical protein n=1 Tax=Mesobacillus maritimus TaxID=1643336 RepID=UPI00203C52EF|nr:hypothetical protein [Mesobacillus maritimus]MCM3585600.1 hypothetical protein [Mesobacillus maritimus]MCM3669072.1 hypothetical protein [Mesobacillus maritimus]